MHTNIVAAQNVNNTALPVCLKISVYVPLKIAFFMVWFSCWLLLGYSSTFYAASLRAIKNPANKITIQALAI
jgi:hypothetical protein